MILGLSEVLILTVVFIVFSFLLETSSQRLFLEGPSADLASTEWFWCRFQFSGFKKWHPFGHPFRTRIYFSIRCFPGEALLSRTLRHLRPKMFPGPGTRIPLIWDRCSTDCGPNLYELLNCFHMCLNRHPQTQKQIKIKGVAECA